jgi:thiamine-monophosphate kinase
MSDVSDAVLVQGAQMAAASGVKFEIRLEDIEALPDFAELARLATEIDGSVLDWILQGGEDHVLLATGVNLPGLLIGAVVEGSGIEVLRNSREIKMAPVSWSHFQ